MKGLSIILVAFALVIVTGCEAPTSSLSQTSDETGTVVTSALAKNGNNGNSHAKATGSVSWRTGAFVRTASFTAHDGAPGSQADRGEMSYRYDLGSFHLKVECVNINGAVALFGGTVTTGDGEFASWVGDTVIFRVEDGGTPGRKGDTFVAAGRAFSCARVNSGNFPNRTPFPVISGNLVVH